jgi:hypothetical protein
MIKGWIDEKTRRKINICGSNFLTKLLEFVAIDSIPEFLGGHLKCSFHEELGPWTDYELIDSNEPGAEVGVRRKTDPFGKIYTFKDIAELRNPVISKQGKLGSSGAVIYKENGVHEPNNNMTESN